MSLIRLAALGVFSAISLNLLLQMGLGMSSIGREPGRPLRGGLLQWGGLFCSVLLLWCFFSYIIAPLSLSFLEYFLIFPLSVAAGKGFDVLGERLLQDEYWETRIFQAESAYDGLILAALFMSLRLANSFIGALIIALGFSLGTLAAALIVRDIARRSAMEQVPAALRGLPLLLISEGLLSLIFSAIAAIILHVLK
ncbi:MAG: hypothetical protein LBT11_00575 [Treponema sp.]|jgi:electron transport complex protein RnfA|nr:hypothetical protein [Treponema sp.]